MSRSNTTIHHHYYPNYYRRFSARLTIPLLKAFLLFQSAIVLWVCSVWFCLTLILHEPHQLVACLWGSFRLVSWSNQEKVKRDICQCQLCLILDAQAGRLINLALVGGCSHNWQYFNHMLGRMSLECVSFISLRLLRRCLMLINDKDMVSIPTLSWETKILTRWQW